MMATELEDLRALKIAEEIADEIWKVTVRWDNYARNVLGGQLSRAADSVGANIAEAYGRYHYGEKIRFLYYARGSLFETKYWLNRAARRQLLSEERAGQFADDLSSLARQLNAFVSHLRSQQSQHKKRPGSVREEPTSYELQQSADQNPLFSEEDLAYLSVPSPQSPISNPQSPTSCLS